ncbi:transposase-like protein [Desulfatibacillum aliphaticivorans]|uniref:Transposase-like protein n=2 Tax=Desulfatibacillum aliphaticivorans TaxID=218208 RepID=B8F9Q6_DESAL|nr:transposase-like protein [Desulfatibacillum aliphaticivorans]ACL05565.1 transposase-like protein [Desulfatibacillum aliphaticivorans]
MAHLHKKMKKGRPYYYVREIARVNGKPKVVNQVYLGSPERILEMATSSGGELETIQCQEYGALWLAHLMEKELGIADIVDSVIPKAVREKGPSVGEYFLYAMYNRMMEACSKRSLPDWYGATAIQAIRPVDVQELSSERYWEKWNRVDEDQLDQIAERFFDKVRALIPDKDDCFLFDTTNYYTYMASDTESDLAKRGKNKAGRDWLRQVGVALLTSRNRQVPLYYKEYEGNRHDSKVFNRLLSQIAEAMKRSGNEDAHLTLVMDKGMNSPDNMEAIDAHPKVHFITTYSLFFAPELAGIPLERFEPVQSPKNQQRLEKGREQDIQLAYRTSGEYWGRERTVVVTFNPLTASRQRYHFDQKLFKIQEALYEMRPKLRRRDKGWSRPEDVEKRYKQFCDEIHMPADVYDVAFEKDHLGWKMSFRKDYYRISKHIRKFGRNVIVTDHKDWSTDEIVQASLDRYKVEMAFRQSKDKDLIGVQPIRHWTDSKISCHILTCIMALTCIRLLEIRLEDAGLSITGNAAMKSMKKLHSCLCLHKGKKKPVRILENPSPLQSQIISALGYETAGGVLQEISK